MRKIYTLTSAILLLVIMMSSCASLPENDGSISLPLTDTPAHISVTLGKNKKRIVVDCDVEMPDAPVSLSEGRINFSQDLYNKMCSVVVNSEENGDDLSFTASGGVYYKHILPTSSWTQPSLRNMFSYGYYEDNEGVGISAEESGESSAQYLAEFSGFDFRPYRVLSSYVSDKNYDADVQGQGQYTIYLQHELDGVPFTTICLPTECIYFDGSVRYFQGLIPYEPKSEKEVAEVVPLETILDSIEQNTDELLCYSNSNGVIYRIALEYYATEIPADSGFPEFVYQPVWSFYGYNETSSGRIDWIITYYAENGMLCNVELGR